MLHSMTAFARYEYAVDHFTLVWEVRSVNHRYLDPHFRLPESVRFLEMALKDKLATLLSRGHIDANLTINQSDNVKHAVDINQDALLDLKRLADEVTETIDVRRLSVTEVLQWPGVVQPHTIETEELEAAVLDSLDLALDDLLSNRQSEGGRLAKALTTRVKAMRQIVSQLQANLADYELSHQEKFRDRIEKLHDQDFDALRLSQEIAILISKADVTEELDRLESHITEFANILESTGPVGRRLDFLLQEFNREANTLGSKSIHKDITNASVELKVLIDQLREQALNIE